MESFRKDKIIYDELVVEESLFSLGNGYLGVRGNFEEGYNKKCEEIRGTYINGLYARIDLNYPESAFGFPFVADKQPRVFDSQTMEIFLDGEKVSLGEDNYLDYKRELVIEKGYSIRSFVYKTKKSKLAKISFLRFVSLEVKELFVIQLKIEYSGDISINSYLNSEVENYTNKNDPRVGSGDGKLLFVTESNYSFAKANIKNSGLEVCCRVGHVFENLDRETESREEKFDGENKITLTKYSVFCDSLRHKNLEEESNQILKQVLKEGFNNLFLKQENHFENFWNISDIKINNNDELQKTIRFSIYQLYQSVGKDDFSNISSKGLSGEGYEGHYFWETEIYIIPYYLVTKPEIVKNLLLFRYNQLEKAKIESKNLGANRGAKFPWRTISGIECSAYYPAGQAQYHINADIGYSIIQYYFATDDFEFIEKYGLELLLETSLFFLEVGYFKDNKFHIGKVTGPDEYTALVTDNYYTNILVQHCFDWTKRFFDLLKTDEEKNTLLEKVNMNYEDLKLIEEAKNKMTILYDAEKNIAMQDDSFLNLKFWNEEDNKRPLLLHYHPLKIYSAQILKQPDTVLAHFLREDITTKERIINSYNYYEKLTTHDSSLSYCLYGMMACLIGDKEKAENYLLEAAYLDIKDIQKNTKDGLHMANLAGTSMYFIYGFAGLRIKENGLSFRPIKVKDFGYSFKIRFKESIISIAVDSIIEIKCLVGNIDNLKVFDKEYNLKENEVLNLDL